MAVLDGRHAHAKFSDNSMAKNRINQTLGLKAMSVMDLSTSNPLSTAPRMASLLFLTVATGLTLR